MATPSLLFLRRRKVLSFWPQAGWWGCAKCSLNIFISIRQIANSKLSHEAHLISARRISDGLRVLPRIPSSCIKIPADRPSCVKISSSEGADGIGDDDNNGEAGLFGGAKIGTEKPTPRITVAKIKYGLKFRRDMRQPPLLKVTNAV